MNKVYFAGGCFWCISDYYLSLKNKGIIDCICGYSGGEEKNATYEMVKSQLTKHRETIEIIYDENLIPLDELLGIYFDYVDINDPDGQFIDKGYSYTLALYYTCEKEKEIYLNKINNCKKPCYVNVEPFKFFIRAEEYHQHYGSKNPEKFMEEIVSSQRTCHIKLKLK